MFHNKYNKLKILNLTTTRKGGILIYRNPSKIIGIKIIGIKIVGIDWEGKVIVVKVSTKGRYGLKALIDIANGNENEPVSITSIASRQRISERYLEQLMSKLKKAGIINSIRGANGGYVLAKEAKDISVGDVLRALEGNLILVDCLGANDEENCGFIDTCATKYVWKRISDSINQTVDEMKLNQLMGENREGCDG